MTPHPSCAISACGNISLRERARHLLPLEKAHLRHRFTIKVRSFFAVCFGRSKPLTYGFA